MEVKINLRAFLSLCWLFLLLIITLFVSAFMWPNVPPEEHLSDSEETTIPLGNSTSDFDPGQISEGKVLFRNNCATCHNKNMKDDMTGPALGGITERWEDFPSADLFQWIRNSQALVQEKHPRAMSLWKEWDKKPMTAFPNLTDEDLTALVAYIERK